MGSVTNLELQQAYGAKLCKVRAAVLEGVTAQYASVLQQERTAGETVNVKRKQDQLLNATKLQNYRRKYEELLVKNDAIEVSVFPLLCLSLYPHAFAIGSMSLERSCSAGSQEATHGLSLGGSSSSTRLAEIGSKQQNLMHRSSLGLSPLCWRC